MPSVCLDDRISTYFVSSGSKLGGLTIQIVSESKREDYILTLIYIDGDTYYYGHHYDNSFGGGKSSSIFKITKDMINGKNPIEFYLCVSNKTLDIAREELWKDLYNGKIPDDKIRKWSVKFTEIARQGGKPKRQRKSRRKSRKSNQTRRK